MVTDGPFQEFKEWVAGFQLIDVETEERALEIVSLLKRMYPKAKCSLDFTSAFELLIATILSAQSTDVRVNIVTKSLFRKYPGPAEFAAASQVEMEKDVRQTGFFRNKAKAVIACGQAIVERHGGTIWAQAAFRAQAPSRLIRPFVSAIGMKRTGGTMPSSGLSQRTSASTPIRRPVSISTCGW